MSLGIFGIIFFRDLEIPVEIKLAAGSLFCAHKELLLSTATLTEPVFWKRTDGLEPWLESICTISHEPLWCLCEGCEKQWSFLVTLGPWSLEGS